MRSRASRAKLAVMTALPARSGSFPGLLFIQPRTTVGDAVRRIAEAAKTLEPPEMLNQIEWIS